PNSRESFGDFVFDHLRVVACFDKAVRSRNVVLLYDDGGPTLASSLTRIVVIQNRRCHDSIWSSVAGRREWARCLEDTGSCARARDVPEVDFQRHGQAARTSLGDRLVDLTLQRRTLLAERAANTGSRLRAA